MDKLLLAAKASSVDTTLSKSDSIMYNIDISEQSTRPEILDYIMIFLCSRITLSFNAFKGGYVLTQLLPSVARATEDIDFSISEEGQYMEIIPVLNELGNDLLSKGIIESFEVKPSISPNTTGGIHMTTNRDFKDIKIDIGFHDLSWGITDWKFNGFDCNRFEVERMLSDKISAMYSRKRFRRTKDIYDFYILTNNFDVSMDKLRNFIELRGSIDWDADPFREDVQKEYAKAYDKLVVRTIKGQDLEKPKFRDIISRLQYFMMNLNNNVKWNHIDRKME